MEQYVIVIERGESNYSAYSPDVLGCAATGATVEETLQQMKMALVMHLEGMAEDGEELPQPKGLAYYVSQDEPVAEPGDLIAHVEISPPAVA